MVRTLPLLIDALAAMGVSVTRGTGSLASFVFTALAAQALGPADSGVLFVSVTWAMGLAIVARWGASDLVLLTFPPLHDGWRRPAVPAILVHYLRASLLRATLVTALAGAVAAAAGPAALARLGIDPLFVCTLLFLTVLQQLLAAAARALGAPVRATLCEFVLVPLLAILALLPLGDARSAWTVAQFEWLYLACAALAVAGLLSIRGMPVTLLRSINPGAIRSNLLRSRSFGLIEASGFLVNWSSLLVTPLLLSVHDAGLLNPALRIAGMVALVAVSVPSVFVPRLAIAERAGSRAEAARLVRSARLVMAMTGAAFYLVVIVAGDQALGLIGDKFRAAYVPLLVIAGGQCGSLALGPSGAVLALRGQERIMRNVVMVSGVLSLLLLVPAIALFGLHGAAVIAGLAPLASKLALRFHEERTRPSP